MSKLIKKEFAFRQADFERIRAKLYQLTGISLVDSKDSMVYSRLARRLRALKMKNFVDYLTFLDRNEGEVQHFINALTTNLTSFFREPHHFDILRDYFSSEKRSYKVWCAGCSTGEEAYSIAMSAVEAYGRYDPPVSIIASDIDSQVLSIAKKGVYLLKHLDKVSDKRKKQFFYKGTGSKVGKVKVVPQISSLIEFKQVNLLDNQWRNIPEDLDVIFCRNVMIYFDKNTQKVVLTKMLNKMKEQGRYFAGHSENFSHLSDVLIPLGKTVYQPAGH